MRRPQPIFSISLSRCAALSRFSQFPEYCATQYDIAASVLGCAFGVSRAGRPRLPTPTAPAPIPTVNPTAAAPIPTVNPTTAAPIPTVNPTAAAIPILSILDKILHRLGKVLVGWHRRRFGCAWKQRDTRARCNGNNCGAAYHAAQKSATIYGNQGIRRKFPGRMAGRATSRAPLS
jgi:hypothetical protein